MLLPYTGLEIPLYTYAVDRCSSHERVQVKILVIPRSEYEQTGRRPSSRVDGSAPSAQTCASQAQGSSSTTLVEARLHRKHRVYKNPLQSFPIPPISTANQQALEPELSTEIHPHIVNPSYLHRKHENHICTRNAPPPSHHLRQSHQ